MAFVMTPRICNFCGQTFSPIYSNHVHCDNVCRFWDKVDIGHYTQCWEWQNAKYSNGYGMFTIRTKNIRASRFV